MEHSIWTANVQSVCYQWNRFTLLRNVTMGHHSTVNVLIGKSVAPRTKIVFDDNMYTDGFASGSFHSGAESKHMKGVMFSP
jgi:hypothetical protein